MKALNIKLIEKYGDGSIRKRFDAEVIRIVDDETVEISVDGYKVMVSVSDLENQDGSRFTVK